MLEAADYFKPHQQDPGQEVRDNADKLLGRVNALLSEVGHLLDAPPKINSGWRPADYNMMVPGAAVRSKHITGQAVDLGDPEGVLDDILFSDFVRNGDECLLSKWGLYLEHPGATKNWCHLQSVPPKSGKRVFWP